MLTIVSRVPIIATIRITIGDDFFPSIAWKDYETKLPIDFTGCTASLVASFRDGTELVMSTANGRIDLVTKTDTMAFELPHDAADFPTTPKEGTFKLQVTDAQQRISTWAKGSVYASD